MHIDDGKIRTYLDMEFGPGQRRRIQAHLDSCARCQVRAEALRLQSDRVEQQIASLGDLPSATRLSPSAARQRLEARRSLPDKEPQSMFKKLPSRLPRLGWAILAVIFLLAVSLAFSPVRAIANSFLGLFRVQQFTVVQVDTQRLVDQFGDEAQLESFLTQNVKVEEPGLPYAVASAAEASAIANQPVRLPAADQENLSLQIQPGGAASYTVDLAVLRALLVTIGRDDIQLPDSLQGAEISLQAPDSVIAQWGECPDLQSMPAETLDPDAGDKVPYPKCTTLIQMPSPTVTAPPGLDLQQLGAAYLQFLGMNPQEAEHFARSIDWASTFVIPLPSGEATYRDIPVDGVTGIMIQHSSHQYMLVWIKDGIIYALSGTGDGSVAAKLANTLQ
jgi:hypothetical protein